MWSVASCPDGPSSANRTSPRRTPDSASYSAPRSAFVFHLLHAEAPPCRPRRHVPKLVRFPASVPRLRVSRRRVRPQSSFPRPFGIRSFGGASGGQDGVYAESARSALSVDLSHTLLFYFRVPLGQGPNPEPGPAVQRWSHRVPLGGALRRSPKRPKADRRQRAPTSTPKTTATGRPFRSAPNTTSDRGRITPSDVQVHPVAFASGRVLWQNRSEGHLGHPEPI